MRIAYIHGSPFGTIGTTASYRIVKEVSKKHDVIVLTPQGQEIIQPIVFNDPMLNVIDIHHNNSMLRIARVLNRIQDFNPDIIHLFNHRQAFKYPYLLRHLLPGKKWILDIRSPLLGKKKQRESINRRNIPLSFYIDAICTHSKASVKTHLPKYFRKVVETPPGVDLERYYPEAQSRDKIHCRRFVFIGSLSPIRKIEFLIENFVAVSKESKERIELDIFGGGPSEENLNECVTSMNCKAVVKIRGVMPHNDLSKQLPSYDAGIAYVPYGPHETAPSLKSLEYAASGIPVLASDTPGHKEYIRRGFRFEFFQNNPNSFRKTIRKAIDEGISTELISSNLDAVKEFDWKAIVRKKLFPLYSNLVN